MYLSFEFPLSASAFTHDEYANTVQYSTQKYAAESDVLLIQAVYLGIDTCGAIDPSKTKLLWLFCPRVLLLRCTLQSVRSDMQEVSIPLAYRLRPARRSL